MTTILTTAIATGQLTKLSLWARLIRLQFRWLKIKGIMKRKQTIFEPSKMKLALVASCHTQNELTNAKGICSKICVYSRPI